MLFSEEDSLAGSASEANIDVLLDYYACSVAEAVVEGVAVDAAPAVYHHSTTDYNTDK